MKSQQSTLYMRETTNLPIHQPPSPSQHSREKQAHNALWGRRGSGAVVVAKSTPNIGWTSGLPLTTDELKERTNCPTDWQSGSWCRRLLAASLPQSLPHWVFTLHVWRRRRQRSQRQEVFCPSLSHAAHLTAACPIPSVPATCLGAWLGLAWRGLAVSCLLGWFLVWFGLACLGLNISYRWEKRVGRVGRSLESVAL